MKKYILSFILTFAMLIGCCSFPAYAGSEKSVTTVSIEYFDDGSYAMITLTVDTPNARASTISGSKIYTYKNSSGVTQWTYTLNGTFSYTGSSSTCTAVSDSYSISDSSWHIGSHSCWKSGNTAYGTVTMKDKFLGITMNTITKNLTLSCSATGVIS